MDLNSESSGDEGTVNDGCVILDVSQPKPVRKRRRRKRMTPYPKKHKWATPPPDAAAPTDEPSLRLLDAVAVVPQPPRPTTKVVPMAPRKKKRRTSTKEERESDAAASNSESEHEGENKEARAYRRVIRRNREAITSKAERVAFDALRDHEQFAYTPKRRRAAPDRLHIKTNKGAWGNLHRSYDKPHAEDVDEEEGLELVREEFGGSPKSTASWHDTDDDHVEAEEEEPVRRGSGESMAPLRSDEGWLSVSTSHNTETSHAAKPSKKKEPFLGKRKAKETQITTSSTGMRAPPGIVYNAFLVRPEGKSAITIPRFTLPDGRSARQAQVSWIPVRYLEMLLFSRYEHGTTGVIFKMLQRMGLGPTTWVIGSAAVTKGEITKANAEFIICTFRELLPYKNDPLLSARTRIVTLIPVASATTICRDRGRTPETIAFLRAFAPREVLPLPTAGPLEPPAKHLQSASDDDDDEENAPLSKRPKSSKPSPPPAPPLAPPPAPPPVAKASWRAQAKPPASLERGNSWASTLAAQTLTSLAGELFNTTPVAATPIVTGAPVESDQDSNATEPYGTFPHPNLDELIRMPRSLQLPRQPPPFPPLPPPPLQRYSSTTCTTTTETTTVNRNRPHSLKWETKSSLELAEAARRELEAQARRAPAKRAPYFFDPKFKSTKPCRYGNECKFRNAGCAFMHPNDQKKLEDRGSTSRMRREPTEQTKHEKHEKHDVNSYVWRPPLENRGFTKNTFRLEGKAERDRRGNVLRPFHETDRF